MYSALALPCSLNGVNEDKEWNYNLCLAFSNFVLDKKVILLVKSLSSSPQRLYGKSIFST